MTASRRIPYLSGYPYEISVAIWRLDDCRQRTVQTLADLHPSRIHERVSPFKYTIAHQLARIAVTETHYLFRIVMQQAIPADVTDLFAAPVPDDLMRLHEMLTPDDMTSTAVHLRRLTTIRARLHTVYKAMRVADYRTPRPDPDATTPEWVLHHLAQQEAERRCEIALLRRFLESADDTPE